MHLISMIGENVHGRIISKTLSEYEIPHEVVIEKGTKRSSKYEKWLAPEFQSKISAKKIIVDSVTNKFARAIYKQTKGFVINGGLPILNFSIIKLCKKGLLNAHPGILPNYRGLDPVKWTLKNKDKIGATIHFIDEGIDSGPIVIKKVLQKIQANNIVELRLEVIRFASVLLAEFLRFPEKYKIKKQKKEEGQIYRLYSDETDPLEKKLIQNLKYYKK